MIKKLILITLSMLIIITTGSVIASCTQEKVTETATKTTTTQITTTDKMTSTTTTLTSTTTPPITTTTTSQITWGELSKNNDFGICGFRCHGDAGQGGEGPAIIGPKANLDFYENALRLFEYISIQMPQDEPGSLSSESYLRILAFILIENGFVQPENVYNIDELINVNLTK